MSAKEAHRMMQMRRISLGGSILNTEINPRKMHERNAYNEAMSATKKKLQSSIEWKEDRIVALVPNRHGVFQPIHVLPQQLKHPFRHVHIFTNRNFVCQPHARLLSVGEDSDSGIHGPQIHASLTKIRKRENINSGGGMSSKKNKRNRTLDDEVTEFDRRGHTKNALSHKHDPKKCLQSHWNRFQKYSYNKPVMTASLREKTRANMLLNDNTDNTDNRDRDYGGDVIDSLVDTQTEITTLADGDCFGGTLHLYLSEERYFTRYFR